MNALKAIHCQETNRKYNVNIVTTLFRGSFSIKNISSKKVVSVGVLLFLFLIWEKKNTEAQWQI